MKGLAVGIVILALAAPLGWAQTTTWTSDPAHSEVDFTISHLGVANVHGRIGKVAATLLWNEADATKSTVTATIDAGTVDTGEETRDTIVKSADFFDVDRFPTATFASTGVAKNGSRLTVTGNLKLRGVSRPVVLDVEGPRGPVRGADSKWHSGFTATTTLSRSAFGIATAFPAGIVGDEVKLTIELEVIKQ
ncbi:MAG: YceI family protein [Terracidiphilus sp.]